MKKTALSIIICSYQREAELYRCLDSILAQQNRQFEVILVDANDKKSFLGKLEYYQQRLPLKVVFNRQRFLSRSRNLGLRAASYQLLSFVDDDTVLASDFVEQVIGAFKNQPRSIIIGGQSLSLTSSIIGQFQEIAQSYPKDAWVNSVVGANFSINLGLLKSFMSRYYPKRRHFFDESFKAAAEETELCFAIASQEEQRIYYASQIRLQHQFKRTLLSFLKSQLYYAAGDFLLWQKYTNIRAYHNQLCQFLPLLEFLKTNKLLIQMRIFWRTMRIQMRGYCTLYGWRYWPLFLLKYAAFFFGLQMARYQYNKKQSK